MYIACEDGSIKILQIKKSRIELIKSMIKTEAKCLSLSLVLDKKHESN